MSACSSRLRHRRRTFYRVRRRMIWNSPPAFGAERSGPPQKVSGSVGQERLPCAAPPSERVAAEMSELPTWFNATAATDPVIKAVLEHLWSITIHPFEDATAASPVPTLILRLRDQRSARCGATACRLRSGSRGQITGVNRSTPSSGRRIGFWRVFMPLE